MKLDDMVSALQSGTLTCELAENIITLIEFVKALPSDLTQCKTKESLTTHDNDFMSDLFNGAINQGLDRAIGHIEDFISTLEN